MVLIQGLFRFTSTEMQVRKLYIIKLPLSAAPRSVTRDYHPPRDCMISHNITNISPVKLIYDYCLMTRFISENIIEVLLAYLIAAMIDDKAAGFIGLLMVF